MKASLNNNFFNQKGSSLVAVFWLIGVLGLSILGATRFVVIDAKWIVGLKSTARAQNLAETGISIASHPAMTPSDPLLAWSSKDGTSSYRAELSSEEGLIPLNHVLFHGQKDVVRRLFEYWSVPSTEAVSIVDSMIDWADSNDLNSLHGAETADYRAMGREGFPFNRPFKTLDEVEWVMGMEKVMAAKPAWKEYFTLWSSGQIDLNETNREITMAAIGADDPTRVSEFIQIRLGEDGIKGTQDDKRFNSVSDVLKHFGANPRPGFSLFTTQGPTKRIVSTGTFHNHQVKIAETRRGRDLLWRMEY